MQAISSKKSGLDSINFFNELASRWDSILRPHDFDTIPLILRRASVCAHHTVLDVGAGTGILTPFLLDLGVFDILAIDSSEKMAFRYKDKFPTNEIITADYLEYDFCSKNFDRIIVYNAFPHFFDKKLFFKKSITLLRPGGILVIAHSVNRDKLNHIHKEAGKEVEHDLLPNDLEMNRLYEFAGFCDIVVENGSYFYSSGKKAD